ncbi:tyrosine--tRNA ligase [Proteiniclasticum sp. BAD-10]|uniref:Tyrosine--tRNA ligase n=1 Tax=Proteiniclasticum sediminis TaxID=2804028 RepID=A0A941CNJ3_9CLOT|nr:tyrosine--tRNA ligase [Proteiniclasticum sediminis]MBR0575169.1 tyrosine--tRNA ligase [Proteiniclasticum sediminis]
MKSVEEQIRIISKGVEFPLEEDALRAKLERWMDTGKPLKIKLGLDPSAPDIHLGHAVVLRKIRQIQDLGHEAIIVIGDFTGRIGDPTGKSKGRSALSEEEVRENAKTYTEQILKVLDPQKTRMVFNSTWLAPLTFEEILRLASTTTVARMMEREDFKYRFQQGVPIGIHEFFYPLMQAYDSVVLEADLELGGTDQTFNILMGRTLQKALGKEPQVALFMPILEGLDGVAKMSKSMGNYIGISEAPEVMFKKVMEVPDALILKYFALATDIHPDELERVKNELERGVNPRDVKYRLATVITGLYHTEEEVEKAMVFYDTAFGHKAIPQDVPELLVDELPQSLDSLVPLLKSEGWISSKGEFFRLLRQGGVQLQGVKLREEDRSILLEDGDVLKLGKKTFVRMTQKG